MEKIFATTEEGIPWKVMLETEYDNGVTLQHWLALWHKSFVIDTKEAFKNLVYVGYCGQMKNAISLKNFRAKDAFKSSSKRKVFNCYLIGNSSCGKVFLFKYVHMILVNIS